MELRYNIHYGIAAAIYLAFLYMFMVLQYGGKAKVNKAFRKMVVLLIIADVLDIVTAITISYSTIVPFHFNMILNSVYFFMLVLLGGQLVKYVYLYNYGVEIKGIHRTIVRGMTLAYIVMLIINYNTGISFYFMEDGTYYHGKLYLLAFCMALFFVVYAIGILCVDFKQRNKKQRIILIMFSVIQVVGPIIQATLVPNVLIGMYCCSLGVVMMIFSLETPDYAKMVKAMDALEEAEKEATIAKEQAIKANEEKSKFLANMSHEIRTPLNSIIGMNQIIYQESTEEEIREYSSDVDNASKILLTLINDILDFSKIESGEMTLILSEYELDEMLRDILNVSMPGARTKGLELKIKVAPEVPNRLYGDSVRIRQIVMNLLSNAIKYTEQGTVTLIIDYHKIDDDNISLNIAVKDTGRGIKEEDKKYLFERFMRVDEYKNKNIEGTGLGLSIVKRLVDLMQGEISFESTYGKGSFFYVRIPQRIVAEQSSEAISEDGLKDKMDVAEDRIAICQELQGDILVVDDSQMNLTVFTGLFRKYKIKIDTALSGQEALELCASKKYDMIFMDHMMPEMDGIVCLEKVRSQEKGCNNDTPIIMLTANAMMGAADEYRKNGFCEYVSKPFRKEEMNKLFIKYLEK